MIKAKSASEYKALERRWLTVKQAAEYLSMHPVTLRRKLYRNEIPHSRIGRTIRIDIKRLDTITSEAEMPKEIPRYIPCREPEASPIYETIRQRANERELKELEGFSVKKGRWHKLELNNLKESIASKAKIAGVYAIFINGKLRYVGESINLIERLNDHLGSMYAYLAQNTRIVFKVRAEGVGEDRKKIEEKMIFRLNPPGNRIKFKEEK